MLMGAKKYLIKTGAEQYMNITTLYQNDINMNFLNIKISAPGRRPEGAPKSCQRIFLNLYKVKFEKF